MVYASGVNYFLSLNLEVLVLEVWGRVQDVLLDGEQRLLQRIALLSGCKRSSHNPILALVRAA